MAIPIQVLTSENYTTLNGWDTKLLVDIYVQYDGKNNGDLCAAWSVLSKRGWNSPATLNRSISKLLNTGFIVLTRQGGRNRASLYAVTFRPIDECDGKLDSKTTTVAANNWKN